MPNRRHRLGRRARSFLLCVAATAALAGAARAADPPRLVASIKPLHALATEVMAGVDAPYLLLPPGASPHAYALKPSGARALAEADLIVWIGPALETFLARPIRARGRNAVVLELSAAKGMVLHPNRIGGEGHHHRGTDPHLWLDPRNGRRIAILIGEALAKIDPGRAERYRANAERAADAIARAEAEIAAILAPVRTVPYVTFHDAYQYFDRRFGTAFAGAITLSPGRQPGARRLAEVRALIAESGARCVFVEPQFSPALAHTVLRGTEAVSGVLDPIGGARGYIGLLRSVAEGMRACLGRAT